MIVNRVPTTLFFSAVASCLITSVFAVAQQSRPPAEQFSIFAYGSKDGFEVASLPVFYRNGLAYMGNLKNMTAPSFTNITFSVSPDDSSAFVVSPVSSGAFDGKPKITINNSKGTYDQVKFSSNASNGTSTGFLLWGDELFYQEDNYLVTKWYATPQPNEAGVYALRWNSDEVDDGKSVAVALRSMGPFDGSQSFFE